MLAAGHPPGPGQGDEQGWCWVAPVTHGASRAPTSRHLIPTISPAERLGQMWRQGLAASA